MKNFNQLFSSYHIDLKDENINIFIQDVLSEKALNNPNKAVLAALYNCLDYTSLNAADTTENIINMVEKINSFSTENSSLKNVAAICVYPPFIKTVKKNLLANDVEIAAVSGGFPSSQTFQEVKIAETSLCIMEGATEIDAVLPIGLFLEKEFNEIADEIAELKCICKEKHLKYILETGLLADNEKIKNAAILALESGVDFIKTSTGKEKEGASLKAVYIMCHVIKAFNKKYNKKAGIKIAGGVSTIEDATSYLYLAAEILGKEYINNKLFRIGSSKLEEKLRTKLLE